MKTQIIFRLPFRPEPTLELLLINPPVWLYQLIAIALLLYLTWIIVM